MDVINDSADFIAVQKAGLRENLRSKLNSKSISVKILVESFFGEAEAEGLTLITINHFNFEDWSKMGGVLFQELAQKWAKTYSFDRSLAT